MSTTYSFLYQILGKIRDILDIAESSTKFTDSTLLTQYIPGAYDNVMSRMSIDNPDEVTGEFDITLDQTTEYYDLPSGVKKVLGMYRLVDGVVVEELPSAQLAQSRQYGWLVQGNMLRILRGTKYPQTFRIRYVPGGVTYSHYGASTGLALVGTDRLGVALSSSPTIGVLEPRPSGLVGQVLRVFVGSQVHERIISAYSPVDRTFDVYVAFPEAVPVDSTSVNYEVVPSELGSITNAVAMNVALTLAAPLRINPNQAEQIRREYAQSLKTAFESIHLRVSTRTNRGTERRSLM